MAEDTTDNRRSTVTAEHEEEARLLSEIWKREKPRLALIELGTQEAFGQHYDIGNQAAVGFFLNGKTAISLKAAVAFARGLGCAVADFSPRLAKQLTPGEILPPPSTSAGRAEMVAEIIRALNPDRQKFLLAFAEQLRGPRGGELIEFLRRLPPRIDEPKS